MKKFDRCLSFATWAYLLTTILALALMYVAGDRWWPATLLLFGPRGALAAPLIPLIPLALWRKTPRLLLPLACGGIIVFGPFMGLRFSLATPDSAVGQALRVLSCNVGGRGFDAVALSKIISDFNVDIVSLQECPPGLKLELPPGWHTSRAGGLRVISRYPLRSNPAIFDMHPPHIWPRDCLLPCIITAKSGEIAFNAVHLPSPRYGLQHLLDKKTGLNPMKSDLLTSETENRFRVSQKVRDAISSRNLPTIIAGDFNMPVESGIYRQHWADLSNAFSSTGTGYGWSFRNYAKGVPIDVRIDHILTGNGFKPLYSRVVADIKSDHRPIMADVILIENPNE